MEVYDIRSQFISMCMMSDGFLTTTGAPEQSNGFGNHQPQEGINVTYFIKNCSFLAGTLPHISKRLLSAIGMDV